MKTQSKQIGVVCFTGDSGLTDYSVSLLLGLGQAGSSTLYTSSAVPEKFKSMGFRVRTPFRRIRHYFIDIFRFILGVLRDRQDVLLVQTWLAFPVLDALAFRLLRLFGQRQIITVHDTLPHHPKPWSRLALGFYYRSFHGAVVHSRISEAALRKMGISVPILTVPHGSYDIFNVGAESSKGMRERLGIPAEALVALLFGTIDTRKGCLEFAKVAQSMRDDGNWHFIIAGRNDLSAADSRELKAAFSSRNAHLVDERIPFEEVQSFFTAANLVVLPYLEGSTSGVFKLAVAFGVPAAASSEGDLGEAVQSGVAMRLGQGGKEIQENLRRVLSEIAEDSEVLAPYARAIQQERERTSWTTIGASYRGFVDELADAGK